MKKELTLKCIGLDKESKSLIISFFEESGFGVDFIEESIDGLDVVQISISSPDSGLTCVMSRRLETFLSIQKKVDDLREKVTVI